MFTINRADELALRKHLQSERNMTEKEIPGLGSAYFWQRYRRQSRPKEEQLCLFERTVRVSERICFGYCRQISSFLQSGQYFL